MSELDRMKPGDRVRNYMRNTGRSTCQWHGCDEPATVLLDAGWLTGRVCACERHSGMGVIVIDRIPEHEGKDEP